MKNKILFIGNQCVKKKSQDLACQSERIFPTQLTWQWSMNMIKVMWCRFQQCFGMSTMLLVEGSSKTVLFRHLSNHVFEALNFGNKKTYEGHLFWSKRSKFQIDFKNAAKNWEKGSCFCDNCISIAIVNLFLWRTRYFSSGSQCLKNESQDLAVI